MGRGTLPGVPEDDVSTAVRVSNRRALELGEVIGPSATTAAKAIRDHPAIVRYERLESASERSLSKYETAQTDLYDFVEMAGLTIEFPVDVERGWYNFELTETRAELDDIQEVLGGSPLSYELDSLVTRTDRQREVLEAAVRKRYLSVPRKCTLAELAETLGIDTSTASTVLRRGQARLAEWFLAGPESTV